MLRLRASLIVLALSAIVSPAVAATPPEQPKTGPGSADYKISEVRKRAVGRASAATFVFHGAEAAPTPRPVVVFLHSWGGANPQSYGGLIEHLARRGYLVLYPRFQEVNRTRPADATANAVSLLKEAFDTLKDDPEARPDRDRVAVIGHLAGVPLALNVAVRAGNEGLPVPKLVFGVMPGGIASDPKSRGIALDDLGGLGASTSLIMMSGDREHLAADRTGRKILKDASDVPANRKLFMRVQSDSHGFPPLTATLVALGSPNPAYDAAAIKLPPDPPRDPKQRPPAFKWTADMALSGQQSTLTALLATNATDTLDYYGFWKSFEIAAEAAFAGKDVAALRADPQFLSMGTWSDGNPVKRLQIEVAKGDSPEAKPEPGPRRRLGPG